MTDRLSKTEIAKDALQEGVESVVSTVGEVAGIITTAVKDVANAIGGLATDAFAIRDAARQAAEKAELKADSTEPAAD
jgi:dihydroxyacetone kinase-like predicted kinase